MAGLLSFWTATRAKNQLTKQSTMAQNCWTRQQRSWGQWAMAFINSYAFAFHSRAIFSPANGLFIFGLVLVLVLVFMFVFVFAFAYAFVFVFGVSFRSFPAVLFTIFQFEFLVDFGVDFNVIFHLLCILLLSCAGPDDRRACHSINSHDSMADI